MGMQWNYWMSDKSQNHSKFFFYFFFLFPAGPTSHPRQRPVGPRQVEGIPRSPSTVSSPGEKPVPNLNTSPQCPRNASTLPSPGEKPNSNLKSSPQCPRNGNNVCNIPVQKAEDNNKIASNDSSRNTQPQADAKSKPCNIESTAGSQAGLVQCRTEQNLGSSPKGSTVQSRAVIDKNLLLISPSQQAKISNLVKVSPLLSKMEKTFKRDVGEEVEDGCEEKSSLPTAPIPKRKSPSSVRKHLFAPQEQETITVSDDDFDLEEIDFVPSVVGSQQNFVPHVKLEKPDDVEMTPEKEDGIQKGLLNTKDGLNSGDTAKPVVKAETPLPAMPSPLTNTKASTSQLSNYNDSINSGKFPLYRSITLWSCSYPVILVSTDKRVEDYNENNVESKSVSGFISEGVPIYMYTGCLQSLVVLHP